jgi:hypothetical protein
VIFPSGNALKYLSEYFDLSISKTSPYAESPNDIKAMCVIPNGDVLGDNVYKTDIFELMANYKP